MTSCPGYHITAPSNWLNDPNGLIQHDGVYHVFYQYNPAALVWGPPHWGHVSSRDLVHWSDHPVALRPGPDGPDRDGCWSGCARLVDGRPTIFYTGVVGLDDGRVESVCRANGSDDLVEWTRDPANPLIPGPPRELGAGYHRDPYLFRSGDGWRLLLGSGLPDRGSGRAGAVLLYESPDLSEWTYRGVLYSRPEGAGAIDTGPVWECPQLVELDGRDVLIFSVQMPDHPRPPRYAVYVVGTVEGTTFHPETMGLLDHGDVFYAPSVTRDDSGRVLAWGWLQESTTADERGAQHAGALSLPRVLGVVDGRVTVRPAPEVVGLRESAHRLAGTAAQPRLTVAVPGRQWELVSTVRGRSGTATIELLDSDGSAACCIAVDMEVRSVSLTVDGPAHAPTVDVAGEGAIDIRVFVDDSIVELFVDERYAVTTRLYQVGRSIRLGAAGGDVGSDDPWLYRLKAHTLLDRDVAPAEPRARGAT